MTYEFKGTNHISETKWLVLDRLDWNGYFFITPNSMTYESIVRGHTALSGTIDYALTNDKGKEQAAVTHFETLNQSELDFPSFNYETSRYSFLKLRPETGRFHQLRKHLAHIRNPIIGDRPHGCNKQNKLFLERFKMNSMMLHASELTFSHPITLEQIVLTANRSSEFDRMLAELSLNVP